MKTKLFFILMTVGFITNAQVYFNVNATHQYSYISGSNTQLSGDAAFDISYYNSVVSNTSFLNLVVLETKTNTPVWVAQNIALYAFPDTQHWEIPFHLTTDMGYNGSAVSTVWYHFTISDSIHTVSPMPGPTAYRPATVRQSNVAKGDNLGDKPILEYRITGTGSGGPPKWYSGNTYSGTYEGCQIPNIDLNDAKYSTDTVFGWPKGMIPYNGDLNGCGPAAASNGIQWLSQNHPEIKQALEKHFGTDSLAQRRMMAVISNLMNKTAASGVSVTDMLSGLLQFIDSVQAPIHVKFQTSGHSNQLAGGVLSPDGRYNHSASNHTDIPVTSQKLTGVDPAWIRSEMEHGETVILNCVYLRDSAGVKKNYVRAHSMVVSGATVSGSRESIRVKDDKNQKGAGGMRQRAANYHSDTTFEGMLRLPELDEEGLQCYVNSVVSMSYDSTIKFEELFDYQGSLSDLMVDQTVDDGDTSIILGGICGFAGNQMQNDKDWYMHLKIDIPDQSSVLPEYFWNIPIPSDRDRDALKFNFDIPDGWGKFVITPVDSPPKVIQLDIRISDSPFGDFYWPSADSPAKHILRRNDPETGPVTGPSSTQSTPIEMEELRLSDNPIFPPLYDSIPYHPPTDLMVSKDSIKKWPSIETLLDGIDRLKSEHPDIVKGDRVELKSKIDIEIRKTRTTDDSLEVSDLIRGIVYGASKLDGKMRIEFQGSSIQDSIVEPKGEHDGLKAYNKSILSTKSGLDIGFIRKHVQSGNAVYVHMGKWVPVGRGFIQYKNGNIVQIVEVIQFGETISMVVSYDENPNAMGGIVKDWIFINQSNGDSLWVVSNKCDYSNGLNKPGDIRNLTIVQDIIAIGYDTMGNNHLSPLVSAPSIQVLGNPFDNWNHTGFQFVTPHPGLTSVQITNAIGEEIASFTIPYTAVQAGVRFGDYISNNEQVKGMYIVNVQTTAANYTYKLLKQ